MRLRREKPMTERDWPVRLELPNVERVHTDSGSHIEPPCPMSAVDAERLAWHAAVTSVDSGIHIAVYKSEDGYQLQVGNSPMSAMSFGQAWTYLNGVSVGAEYARLEVSDKEAP